jgi:hypothetical protein
MGTKALIITGYAFELPKEQLGRYEFLPEAGPPERNPRSGRTDLGTDAVPMAE